MPLHLDNLVLRRLATALGDPDAAQQIITLLNAIVAGNVTGAQVIVGTLSVSDVATLSSDVTVGGNEAVAGNVAVTGNETVGGTFGVTGISTLASLVLTGKVRLKRATVAAAGTTKGNAAALATGFSSVTAADGTKGVILPVLAAGEVCVVVNTVAGQNLKVYPSSGAAIDAMGADAPLVLATKMAILAADSATQIYSLVGA